jgi:hypothetical protein
VVRQSIDIDKEFAMPKRKVDVEEAQAIGTKLGIDFSQIDLDEFRRGLEIEFEHGAHDPETNVTNDDPIMTGKIAWAHLKELADYYTRLDRMEAEAEGKT